MGKFKNEDLLLVNSNEETYTATGEAFITSWYEKPVIDNVNLVETNPGVDPRFTSQEMVATVTLSADGVPQSEKTIDAFVEGTILDDIESSVITEVEVINKAAGVVITNYGNIGSYGVPADLFDGEVNNFGSSAWYVDLPNIPFDNALGGVMVQGGTQVLSGWSQQFVRVSGTNVPSGWWALGVGGPGPGGDSWDNYNQGDFPWALDNGSNVFKITGPTGTGVVTKIEFAYSTIDGPNSDGFVQGEVTVDPSNRALKGAIIINKEILIDGTILTVTDDTNLDSFVVGKSIQQNSAGAPETSAITSAITVSGAWLTSTAATNSGGIADVLYADSKWVTVGANGSNIPTISVSTDGTLFTAVNGGGDVSDNFDYKGVAYGLNTWVAVAANISTGTATGKVAVSSTALAGSWVMYNSTDNECQWQDVCFGGDRFVAVGDRSVPGAGASRIMYSTNGTTWTASSTNFQEDFSAVTYGGGLFVAVTRGGDAYYSSNGSTWTRSTTIISSYDWIDIAYGDGKFVASGYGPDRATVWVSTDGSNWQLGNSFADVQRWTAIAYGNGSWTALGNSISVAGERAGFSSDGLNWVLADVNPNPVTGTGISQGTWSAGTYGPTGFLFVAFNLSGSKIQYSASGGMNMVDLTLNDDTNLANLQVGDAVTETSGDGNGTVRVIGATSLTIISNVGTWTNGDTVTGPALTASGTLTSISGTTLTVNSSSGRWLITESDYETNKKLNKKAKQLNVPVDGTKKYLKFDSFGNVETLLDTPQSPAYKTTDENPVLTLKFPATFPSGFTPDEELGEGVTLTVEASATNVIGSDGPKSETVQPEVINDFTAPIESIGTVNTTIQWVNYEGEAIIISDNGLDLAKEDNNSAGARATGLVRTTGKYYFEIRVVTAVPESRDRFDVGWGNTASNNAYWLCDNKRFWGTQNGRNFVKTTHNLSNNGTDYITMCAIDYNSRKIWYGIDGAWYNNEIPSSGNNTYFNYDQSLADTIDIGMRITHSMGAPGCETFINPTPQYAPSGFLTVADYDQLVFQTDRNFDKFAKEEPIYQLDENANGICGVPDTASRSITLRSSEGTWEVGQQCRPEVTIRSLTAEELEAQKLKFLTYSNRKEVVCGEEASAARAALQATLIEAGYEAADIAQAYSNLDN